MSENTDAYPQDDRYLVYTEDEVVYEVVVPTRSVERLTFRHEHHALNLARLYLSYGYEGTRVIRRTTRTEHMRLAALNGPSQQGEQ